MKGHTNTPSLYCILSILLAPFLFPVTSISQTNKLFPKESFLTKFRFELLEGGVMVLRAKLDSFPDSLNFILDTGSGGISLDSTTVEDFHLPVTPSENILRGIGSMRKINYVYNQTL